jgi:site-specific DNA recombinase
MRKPHTKDTSPPTAEKIAALYSRVSTEDQGKGYSIPTQIAACQELARREGYVVPPECIFTDNASGTTLDRPGLIAVRELIRARRIQALICFDLDRISRRLAHQLLIDDECRERGVSFHIVTMPDDDNSPESQFMRNIRGAVAEFERLKIIERSTRGLRGRAQAGHVGGGQVPLG